MEDATCVSGAPVRTLSRRRPPVVARAKIGFYRWSCTACGR
jgi:hypothetical protein